MHVDRGEETFHGRTKKKRQKEDKQHAQTSRKSLMSTGVKRPFMVGHKRKDKREDKQDAQTSRKSRMSTGVKRPFMVEQTKKDKNPKIKTDKLD